MQITPFPSSTQVVKRASKVSYTLTSLSLLLYNDNTTSSLQPRLLCSFEMVRRKSKVSVTNTLDSSERTFRRRKIKLALPNILVTVAEQS